MADHSSLRFRLAPEFLQLFPDAFIAVVAASGVPNDAPVAAIEEGLRAAEAEARRRLDGTEPAAHPFIARWREAFKRAGVNPIKHKSSVEALLTRVHKGGALPALSPAVDLANTISLRYLLPVGAHDVDRLTGDLTVRPARAASHSTPSAARTRARAPRQARSSMPMLPRYVRAAGSGARATAPR